MTFQNVLGADDDLRVRIEDDVESADGQHTLAGGRGFTLDYTLQDIAIPEDLTFPNSGAAPGADGFLSIPNLSNFQTDVDLTSDGQSPGKTTLLFFDAALLNGLDGILVPGGFGDRGAEGKIDAIRYAREESIPFFGICLGLQLAVVEFARSKCGLPKANSREFDKDGEECVVDLMPDQHGVVDKGGTMRLGAQPCALNPDSRAAACYGSEEITERHRHRYEFNPDYEKSFTDAGMIAVGIHPERKLVEVIEIPEHPWFVAVQYHPEFKSKPDAAHPLFCGFIQAAQQRHHQRMQATV